MTKAFTCFSALIRMLVYELGYHACEVETLNQATVAWYILHAGDGKILACNIRGFEHLQQQVKTTRGLKACTDQVGLDVCGGHTLASCD